MNDVNMGYRLFYIVLWDNMNREIDRATVRSDVEYPLVGDRVIVDPGWFNKTDLKKFEPDETMSVVVRERVFDMFKGAVTLYCGGDSSVGLGDLTKIMEKE